MKTPPTSASLPENVVSAKANFIAAAFAASPARAVERHPLTSVAAVAGVALAATVIIGQPVVAKVGGGLATNGLGLLTSLIRSPLLNTILNATAAGRAGAAPANAPASSPS